MVVTRQDHHQRFLHQQTERQPWQPSFPSKKSCINLSFRKAVRKQRRVLTRDHHVDVRQFVAQDPQGFGHPRRFVSGQKAHGEAWLGGMGGPAGSVGCRFHLREHQAGVVEKGSARRCQLDAASAACQESRAYLVLKVSNLPAQRRLRGVQPLLCCHRQTSRLGHRDEIAKMS
jgi:hypothetical protein